jgi:hypothetical protein
VLGKRRKVIAVAVALVIVGVIVIALIVTSTSGTRRQTSGTSTSTTTASGASGTPQPHVPPGWKAQKVGIAMVAVPDGWRSITTGVGGITLASWSPGRSARGALPSRCVVQERPQWLISFLHSPNDWAGALRRDLADIKAETTQEVGPVTITDEHPIRVRGALGALGFDAVVSDSSSTADPRLQSSDLLAALPNGTEVHVFCSGALGTLPTHLSDGVESTTLGSAQR